LSSLAKERGLRTASMWANVPHYVNASPNPKGTLALLEKLNGQLHLDLKLHDLEVFAARFDAQVASEVEKNPEMTDYARRIQEQEDRESDDTIVLDQEDAETLPDSSEVVDELERFLREQRGNS
jgi:proteasome assembly chaperone (PAC2) family protein